MKAITLKNQLDWQKVNGLMPVIIQHSVSGQILMQGYMNPEAFEKTLDSGKVTFYSRSKQRLWVKGETSGHFLQFVQVHPDCDLDCLLILALPIGPTCHKGSESCFGEVEFNNNFLFQLEQLIQSRKYNTPETSYTAKLFTKGTKRIAQKVGEEGVETALAAMAGDAEELKNEAADLLYHLLVLLQDQSLNLGDVIGCLKDRHTMITK